jgi:hypothetical protein
MKHSCKTTVHTVQLEQNYFWSTEFGKDSQPEIKSNLFPQEIHYKRHEIFMAAVRVRNVIFLFVILCSLASGPRTVRRVSLFLVREHR